METKTHVQAGRCPANWDYGKVEKATGGGFYGQIRGSDGLVHFFNNGYTEFYPRGEGVVRGQWVDYAPFPSGNPRAGKAACIRS